MADYYWYDKYDVNEKWTDSPASNEQVIGSKYLFSTGNIIESTPDIDGEYPYGRTPFESYGFEAYATYGDYKSNHFKMINELTMVEAHNRGFIYIINEQRTIDGHNVILEILRGYTTYYYNGRYYWVADKRIKLFDYDQPTSEWPKVYNVGTRGQLLETDLIKPNTYPIDGIRDGFWWVRKEPYTYPPPILLSPKNGYIVRIDEGEEVPYLVIELQERFAGSDSNLYHVRISMGFNSDFKGTDLIFESKIDNSMFEYSTDEGANWNPFPSGGVPALSWVRIKPDTALFGFGFYYWSATAYGSQWGYGKQASPRMLISITDTDDVYFLTINGKRYYAKDIMVKESSNGEISNVNFTLLNNKI